MTMSLKMRRLGGWCGKLFSTFLGVNVACAPASRHVPEEIAADVREYLGNASRAPSTQETLDGKPREIWKVSVGRGILGAPAITSRVIVVASTDRWIYALDTRTGDAFWRRRGDGAFSTGPLVSGGRVFVASEGTGGRVTSLRLRDGSRVWSTATGDVAAPLTLNDSTLYGVNRDGVAFALHAGTGRLRWRRPVGPSLGGPIIVGDRVVIATLRDSLVAIDATSGSSSWAIPSPAPVIAPLAMADDSTITLESPDGSVHAVAMRDGKTRWSVRTTDPLVGSPAIVDSTVLVMSDVCALITLRLSSGTIVSRRGLLECLTTTAPMILRHGVLVATVMGDVVFVSRTPEATDWTLRLGGSIRHPPIVRDRLLVVTRMSGEMFGFR
jgi:outer membrane protein assembly factor BamB